jgi:hypothetical protein
MKTLQKIFGFEVPEKVLKIGRDIVLSVSVVSLCFGAGYSVARFGSDEIDPKTIEYFGTMTDQNGNGNGNFYIEISRDGKHIDRSYKFNSIGEISAINPDGTISDRVIINYFG